MNKPWTPHPKPEPGRMNVFTDGSFWEGSPIADQPAPRLAAWCAIAYYTDIEEGHTKDKVYKGLCDVNSSMEAELHAIVEAFEVIPEGVPAQILTDAEIDNQLLSLWASNNFLNSRGRALKLKEERERIYNLRESRPEIQIISIKGHSKISQQEKTDRCVRQFLRKKLRERGHDRSRVSSNV